MMPNSKTSDSNGYEDSLHMDPKDTRLAETAEREAQGREPAEGGMGSRPGGSTHLGPHERQAEHSKSSGQREAWASANLFVS